MRDDRYKGTTLPRPVRKLCRMAERDADRARPDRLCHQAMVALQCEAAREISTEFQGRLQRRDVMRSLFGADDLATVAKSGLEVSIARIVDAEPGLDSTAAVCAALRQRGERYVHEQKCQLIADRDACAMAKSQCVKDAFDEGAVEAARLILAGQPVPKSINRVRVVENLLMHPSGGVGK